MEVGTRGEFGQDPLLRLRTPDTLSERGREELTGTNDKALVFRKGSDVEETEFRELVEDISTDEGAGGGNICDSDIGV